MSIFLKKSGIRTLYLFILIHLTCTTVYAGSFEVVFAPSEMYYKDQSSETWAKATCGTILSENSTLKLPNFSYLMLLHSSGKIYSGDTVGLIHILALEKLMNETKNQPFSSSLLKQVLGNSDLKNQKEIFYFCEGQTSSRCCGSYYVFGGETSSLVRNNNSKIRWINTDKIKNNSFQLHINNLYGEEILSRSISENEFIPIPSKLIGKLKSDDFLNVRIVSDKTEVTSVLRLMPQDKESNLKNDLELLKKEYASENDLQYLICRYLVERNHRVLLECGETYYSIFNTIQLNYGKYNSEYFKFFYQASVTQTGYLISMEGRKLLIKSTSGMFNIPKGTTLTLSNSISGLNNTVGTGIVEEETQDGVLVTLNSVYSSNLKNAKSSPTLKDGDLIEINWIK